MKKTIILVALFITGLATFAQKNEIKDAESALKENKYTEAINILKGAESLLPEAKDKLKAQYYLTLGKAYYANGTTPKSFKDAADALNQVISIEKNGSKTYSDEAGILLNTLIQKVAEKASNVYSEALKFSEDPANNTITVEKFSEAAEGFEEVYHLSVRDTAFLQNAAYIYYFAEKYNKSIDTYKKLLDLGYKGINTTYSAINKETNKEEFFANDKELALMMKSGLYKNSEIKKTEPQTTEIKKMIVKNYLALKENEKALAAIQEAKISAPTDYGLLVDEANVYYAMGNNVKFKEKLEEAVQINPSDYVLHYNIGVMKSDLKDFDGAIESYKKAIALKADYGDAYNNIGAAILEKALPLVEEMNKSLNDFNKYDKLQAKQMELYKEALPYFEKAFEINSTNINVVQTLRGIYEQLGMYDKSKEMKVVYDKLKN